jgi:hypothetical protein
MWCADCWQKFRWYVKFCPECGVELVEDRPGPAPDPDAKLVRVFLSLNGALTGIAKRVATAPVHPERVHRERGLCRGLFRARRGWRIHRGVRDVCDGEVLQILRGIHPKGALKRILRPDQVGTQDDRRTGSE